MEAVVTSNYFGLNFFIYLLLRFEFLTDWTYVVNVDRGWGRLEVKI